MAASWGLAFEYGKNAYTDMMRKQEELDRYLAERELWRAKLTEEEEATAMKSAINREARAGALALTKSKQAIINGDDDAFVNTLNEISVKSGIKYEKKGSKVYRIANGTKTEAFDLKSNELKNGASRVAVIQNMVDPASSVRDQHVSQIESNRANQLEYDKLANAREVARIGANAKITAAGLSSLAKTTTSGGKKGKTINWSKEDLGTASTYAVPLVFGTGATGARDEEGRWTVTNTDGSIRQLSEKDVQNLETAFSAMKTQTENEARDTDAEPSVVMTDVFTELADKRAKAKFYNDQIDAFNKDNAAYMKDVAARDAIIARNAQREKAIAALESQGLASIAENISYETVPELRAKPVFFDAKNNPGLVYRDWLTNK